MIQRLLTFLERRSQPTEQDTEYDGFLSYAGEFHALSIGLSVGVSSAVLETPEIAASVCFLSLGLEGSKKMKERLSSDVLHEIRREGWYSVGGILIGFAAGLLGKNLGLL